MWQIRILPTESVMDAPYTPAPVQNRSILRRIADFFRGGDSDAL